MPSATASETGNLQGENGWLRSRCFASSFLPSQITHLLIGWGSLGMLLGPEPLPFTAESVPKMALRFFVQDHPYLYRVCRGWRFPNLLDRVSKIGLWPDLPPKCGRSSSSRREIETRLSLVSQCMT